VIREIQWFLRNFDQYLTDSSSLLSLSLACRRRDESFFSLHRRMYSNLIPHRSVFYWKLRQNSSEIQLPRKLKCLHRNNPYSLYIFCFQNFILFSTRIYVGAVWEVLSARTRKLKIFHFLSSSVCQDSRKRFKNEITYVFTCISQFTYYSYDNNTYTSTTIFFFHLVSIQDST